ncbi:MAG: hypothetical protein IKK40_06075, partial [Bacteroidales bacterium]|nr:hypothetical protein [Bacteroidales bacterium]
HLLQKLCKEDLLISYGHGRGTIYSLKGASSDPKSATLQDKDASSNPKDATLQDKDASSDPKGATLQDKDASSNLKGATLQDKGASSNPKGATSISSRMSKEELRKAILAYCSEWRTAAEIALYLGKTKPYIRNKVLPQMSDVLQMLFPKENHPGQKYKVKGE